MRSGTLQERVRSAPGTSGSDLGALLAALGPPGTSPDLLLGRHSASKNRPEHVPETALGAQTNRSSIFYRFVVDVGFIFRGKGHEQSIKSPVRKCICFELHFLSILLQERHQHVLKDTPGEIKFETAPGRAFGKGQKSGGGKKGKPEKGKGPGGKGKGKGKGGK